VLLLPAPSCAALRALQVVDDILDVTQTTEMLGKTAAKDLAVSKTTYPKLLGLEASKQTAEDLIAEVCTCVRACVRACIIACVHTCVRAFMCACVRAFLMRVCAWCGVARGDGWMGGESAGGASCFLVH